MADALFTESENEKSALVIKIAVIIYINISFENVHRFDNNSSSRLYFCQRQTYSFEVEKLITEMC